MKDLHKFNLKGNDIEAEANTFASYLLMPMDDFRNNVPLKGTTFDDISNLSDRYAVSLTAAALKWLELTVEAAFLVVSNGEEICWARPSEKARFYWHHFKRGKKTPERALARGRNEFEKADLAKIVCHPPGVWHPEKVTDEVTFYAGNLGVVYSLVRVYS